MTNDQRMGFGRRTFVGCGFIIIAIVVCSISLMVGIDARCYSDIEESLPLYPNATLVSTTGGFFRPRAMGLSRMVLTTPDSPTTVRQWYGDYTRRLNQSRDGQRRVLSLSAVNYSLQTDETTGQTLILLDSECAFN